MTRIPSEVRRGIARELFRYDLQDLDEAYANAIQGAISREAEIEEMVRGRLGLGPYDDFPDPDPDDPDDPIAMLYEQASEMEQQRGRSAHIVRKAFLIALFHLWERHHYPKPLKSLDPAERKRQRDLLEDLRYAANAAKHQPGPSVNDLFERRPDLFPRLRLGQKPSERWLEISPDTLNAFFEAVWSTIDIRQLGRALR